MNNELDGKMSIETPVDYGVPQGTVLGPLLFLCHVNVLLTSVKSKVRLFVDDCLLYRMIETFTDNIVVQNDLTRLGRTQMSHHEGMQLFHLSSVHSPGLGSV